MKVLIDKSFEKDIIKINNNKILHAVANCIESVQKAEKLSGIPGCAKLKGSKNAYRIRIGDYRVGFIFENQTVYFIRFLHRSKIYYNFPD